MSPVHYFLAAFIGGLVGVIEIFQRYRAEPLQAIENRWGASYVLVNALLAALAFHVLILSGAVEATSPAIDKLQWVAVAGFGTSALLHSKLLNVQLSDGREVALGPEIVVQTFLDVIDRELDRIRARVRYDTVHRLMDGIDFERARIRLTMQIFQAMQGVTEEESGRLVERIAEVDEMQDLDSQDKSYLLGFYLLDLVGADFLEEILPRYRSDFEFVDLEDEV